MASSFITQDNVHGFWVHDSFLQVVAWGMVNVIDEMTIPDDIWPKGEFRDHVFYSSQGYFVGFTTLGITAEYIASSERRIIFNDIINKVRSFFLSKGDWLSPEELNAFQLTENTARKWIEPLETKRILKILEYLEKVINDQITIQAGDFIDYEF